MRHYGRFTLTCCAAALLGAPAAAVGVSTAPARGVVLIIADTLRADRVGARTPAFDRWARRCAVFTSARAQAPWTLPSLASLFTSLHPSRHGLVNRYRDFSAAELVAARLRDTRPDARTWAELLSSEGWRTAAFTGGGGLSADAGLEAGFDVFDGSPTFSGFARTVPLALAWLDGVKPGERFFLVVHGYDAHSSHPGRLEEGLRERHKALRAARLEGAAAPADAQLRRALVASYDAGVEELDRRLAPLLARLATRGLADVAVVATSDHGEELFERGGVDHGMTLNEELLRVPLVVCGPGVPGRRVTAPVRLVDVLPTALDLAGVSPDPAAAARMDGVSLRPLWEGRPLPLDSFAETDFLLSASLRSVVTHDGWKAVLNRDSGHAVLYRLAGDPGETRDESGSRPELAAALTSRLRTAGPAEGSEDAGARRGAWKALRRDGRVRLYDLARDPYLTRDVSADEPQAALDLTGELLRRAQRGTGDPFKPSDEMRRKLRAAGYW